MGIGIFRQLDNGRLEPVATRRTKEEAEDLILSLEKLWAGAFVFRELQYPAKPFAVSTGTITPSEAFDLPAGPQLEQIVG